MPSTRGLLSTLSLSLLPLRLLHASIPRTLTSRSPPPFCRSLGCPLYSTPFPIRVPGPPSKSGVVPPLLFVAAPRFGLAPPVRLRSVLSVAHYPWARALFANACAPHLRVPFSQSPLLQFSPHAIRFGTTLTTLFLFFSHSVLPSSPPLLAFLLATFHYPLVLFPLVFFPLAPRRLFFWLAIVRGLFLSCPGRRIATCTTLAHQLNSKNLQRCNATTGRC